MANYKHVAVVIGVSLLMTAGLAFWAGGHKTPAELKLLDTETTATSTDKSTTTPLTSPLTPEEQKLTTPDKSNTMNPTVQLTTNKGVIEIELYNDIMPVTTANFEKLVKSGYYDGIKFHRVIDGFMIQGGDPLTKNDADMNRWGTGGPGYSIADEFSDDARESNTRGTIAMANSGPNTGGSQFFINTADNLFLDGKHPVFGRVTKGLDIVDAISKVPRNSTDRPLDAIVIEKAVMLGE
jgi:peptidylprolyl isomerase